MLYNIIFSPTGGTQKVADIILKNIANDFITIDLTLPDTDFSSYKIQKEDIAVISIPSFGGRAPKVAIERLQQIKSNNTKTILICVYGNRAYEDTLIEMQDVAENLGFNVIAAISAIAQHSIVNIYGTNRPDDEDIKQLEDFASTIKERISSSYNAKIEILGNRPYKKSGNVGLIPKTNNNCTNCKKCANLCPTGAISKTDIKIIDKSKCITCMRCITFCPNNAKRLSRIATSIISFILKKVCTKRKENQLF